jgi:hypothetical protein
MKVFEKQLKWTWNDASIFNNWEFNYKTLNSSELKTYPSDSPSIVKEWEVKIKNW